MQGSLNTSTFGFLNLDFFEMCTKASETSTISVLYFMNSAYRREVLFVFSYTLHMEMNFQMKSMRLYKPLTTNFDEDPTNPVNVIVSP